MDYIKIDAQGAELCIFQNGCKVLERVVLIHTEVSFVELYEDQPLFADVDTFLRSKGFQFIRFSGFGMRCLKPLVMGGDVEKGHQMLWADAVYMRALLTLGNVPTEKLLKLACLAHDVYGLHDFTLYLLRLVDARRGGRC